MSQKVLLESNNC